MTRSLVRHLRRPALLGAWTLMTLLASTGWSEAQSRRGSAYRDRDAVRALRAERRGPPRPAEFGRGDALPPGTITATTPDQYGNIGRQSTGGGGGGP